MFKIRTVDMLNKNFLSAVPSASVIVRVRVEVEFVITLDTKTTPAQPWLRIFSRELGHAVAHDSARTLARDSQPHSGVAPQGR